jgi:hypothetical protein
MDDARDCSGRTDDETASPPPRGDGGRTTAGRRRFLAAGAATGAAALAGCLGRVPGEEGPGDGGPDGGTPTPLAMGERADVDGGSATLSNPRVQRTYVYDNGVWQTVRGDGDAQYLLVDVATTGFERPFASWLDVVLDGTSLDAEAAATGGDAEVAAGTVALTVPVQSADAGTVRWTEGDGAAWTLPDHALAALASAAEFDVTGATFHRGDGLSVEVRNDGDRDGTFRLRAAPSNAYDISSVHEVAVPAGDTATLRAALDELAGLTPAPGVELELSWGTGSTTVKTTTPTPPRG